MKWLVIVPALLLIAACDGVNDPASDEGIPADTDTVFVDTDEFFEQDITENDVPASDDQPLVEDVEVDISADEDHPVNDVPTDDDIELEDDPVVDDVPMPENDPTVDNDIIEGECVEGERRCADSSTVEECTALGAWEYFMGCFDGSYCVEWEESPGYYYAECQGGTDYYESDQDLKPNIYLYPTAPLDITVKIGFPQGGHVTVSEPLYGDGWDVRVTPDGLIDGQWRFLFYESVQPNGWQRERGYLVATDEMEQFFRNDLAARGFVGQEIEDFIEWWMPLLAEPGYLIVYPQDDAVIRTLETLELSVTPDSLLRHRYVIETTAEPVTIEPPDAPAPFTRDGFTVTEWGVIRL
jgi:hypothetical protein